MGQSNGAVQPIFLPVCRGPYLGRGPFVRAGGRLSAAGRGNLAASRSGHKVVIAMAGTSGGRPSIYPTLLYADAKAAIRQLTEASASPSSRCTRARTAGEHAELTQGNGAVMLGTKGSGSVFDAR